MNRSPWSWNNNIRLFLNIWHTIYLTDTSLSSIGCSCIRLAPEDPFLLGRDRLLTSGWAYGWFTSLKKADFVFRSFLPSWIGLDRWFSEVTTWFISFAEPVGESEMDCWSTWSFSSSPRWDEVRASSLLPCLPWRDNWRMLCRSKRDGRFITVVSSTDSSFISTFFAFILSFNRCFRAIFSRSIASSLRLVMAFRRSSSSCSWSSWSRNCWSLIYHKLLNMYAIYMQNNTYFFNKIRRLCEYCRFFRLFNIIRRFWERVLFTHLKVDWNSHFETIG